MIGIETVGEGLRIRLNEINTKKNRTCLFQRINPQILESSFNPQEKNFMESTTNIKEKYCLKWSKVQVTHESRWRVALRIWLIGAREEKHLF